MSRENITHFGLDFASTESGAPLANTFSPVRWLSPITASECPSNGADGDADGADDDGSAAG